MIGRGVTGSNTIVMRRVVMMVATLAVIAAVITGCGGAPSTVPETAITEVVKLLSPPPVLEPRHFFYGLALPYPIAVPEIVPIHRAPFDVPSRTVELVLTIGSNGQVVGIRPKRETDSAYVECYADDLRTIRFEPGLRDSVAAQMNLPVGLQVSSMGSEAQLLFPVTETRAIPDYYRYEDAIKLNGVTPPSVVDFPSYVLPNEDDARPPEFFSTLFRLELDSLGRLTALDSGVATYDKYTRILRAAAQWAGYTPLLIDSTPRASVAYLCISHHPEIRYSSRVHPRDSTDTPPWLKQWQIRLLVDTVGVMSVPVPTRFIDGTLSPPQAEEVADTVVSMRVTIDTIGTIERMQLVPPRFKYPALVSQKGRSALGRIINMLTRSLQFYPALGFDGRPRVFSGLIHIRFTGEPIIRIGYDWLPGLKIDVESQRATPQ